MPVAELNREEKELLELQSVLQNRLDTYDAETLDELERARQVLRAVEDLGAWAETYGRYQAVSRNGIKGYINTGAPPVDESVARYVAVARPEWLTSEPPESFDKDESAEAFSELLDRLQAEVLVHFAASRSQAWCRSWFRRRT